jgi:hypothetical protein
LHQRTQATADPSPRSGVEPIRTLTGREKQDSESVALRIRSTTLPIRCELAAYAADFKEPVVADLSARQSPARGQASDAGSIDAQSARKVARTHDPNCSLSAHVIYSTITC